MLPLWLTALPAALHGTQGSSSGRVGGSSPGRVVFVRHGQSEFNAEGRFTGWMDVSLTQVGREEALAAGELLLDHGISVDVAFTSELSRAQETTSLLLERVGLSDIPVKNDYRINERHYGALQGSGKEEAVALYGREQVKLWRNSYTVPPPALSDDDPRHPAHDPRYASVPRDALPNAECLRDTLERCLPFWQEEVEPLLLAGRNVLISAHGHSIRALVKALDGLDEDGRHEMIEALLCAAQRYSLLDFDAGDAGEDDAWRSVSMHRLVQDPYIYTFAQQGTTHPTAQRA